MPNKCCVIGCKRRKEKVQTFPFPKGIILKQKWLQAIGRKNFTPSKHSVVCQRHFLNSDLIKDPHNHFQRRLRLNEKAIPSVDLNTCINNESKEETNTNTVGSSSDDDNVPLGKLKNSALFVDSSSATIKEDTDKESQLETDSNLRKKIKKLVEDYEQLKHKSLGLNQEIKVLENVNIELKCKIFK